MSGVREINVNDERGTLAIECVGGECVSEEVKFFLPREVLSE